MENRGGGGPAQRACCSMTHPPIDEPIVLGVYEELWRANARIRIPQTLLWRNGKIVGWFFTSRQREPEGPKLMRKNSSTMQQPYLHAKILEAFTKGFSGAPHEAVARYIGSQTAGGPAAIVHLTKHGLQDFLAGKTGGDVKGHGVLQQWFPPSGENAYGVRCLWTSHRCGLEIMQNTHSHRDAKVELSHRLATFEGPCRSVVAIATMTANLRRSATQLADEAAAALDALLMPMRRVWALDLTLLPDSRGVFHFSWCSRVALAERGEDGVYRKMYVTPDPAKTAALRAYEMTRREVEAGRIQYSPAIEQIQRSRIATASGSRANPSSGGGASSRGVESSIGVSGPGEDNDEKHDIARQGLPPELEGVPLDELDEAEKAYKEKFAREKAAARAAELQAESKREPAALARAHKLFDELDSAGTGSVSRAAYAVRLESDALLDHLLKQGNGSSTKHDIKNLMGLDSDGSQNITWEEFLAAAGLAGVEAFWSTSANEARYYESIQLGDDERETEVGPPPSQAYVPEGYVPKPPPKGPAVRDGTIFHVPSYGMTTYQEPPWMSRSYALEKGPLPDPAPPRIAPIGGTHWLPLHLQQAVFDDEFGMDDQEADSAIDDATLARLAEIQARLERGDELSAKEVETLRICEQIAQGDRRAEDVWAEAEVAHPAERGGGNAKAWMRKWNDGESSRVTAAPPPLRRIEAPSSRDASTPAHRPTSTRGKRNGSARSQRSSIPSSPEALRVSSDVAWSGLTSDQLSSDPEAILELFRASREADTKAEERKETAVRAARAIEALTTQTAEWRSGLASPRAASSAGSVRNVIAPRQVYPSVSPCSMRVGASPAPLRSSSVSLPKAAMGTPRPSSTHVRARHLPINRPSKAEIDADVHALTALHSAEASRRQRLSSCSGGTPHVRATAELGVRAMSPTRVASRAQLRSAPVTSKGRRMVMERPGASAPSSDQLPSLRPPSARGGFDGGWEERQRSQAELLAGSLPRSMVRAVRSYKSGMVEQGALFRPNLTRTNSFRHGSAQTRPVSTKGVRGLRLQSEFEPEPPMDDII